MGWNDSESPVASEQAKVEGQNPPAAEIWAWLSIL